MNCRRASIAHRSARSGEAGVSLLEGVISAALILFLSVSVLPLFTTARIANISGHDSSVASYETRSWLDSLLTRDFEDPSFDLVAPAPGYTVRVVPAPGGSHEELVMPAEVWSTSARTPSGHLHTRLGDAGWVPAPTSSVASGPGLTLWRREGLVRDYAYADIASGVIDTTTGNTLVTSGHPDLFDTPQPRSAPPFLRQFKEHDLVLVSQRSGGEDFGVGRMNSHFFRTF